MGLADFFLAFVGLGRNQDVTVAEIDIVLGSAAADQHERKEEGTDKHRDVVRSHREYPAGKGFGRCSEIIQIRQLSKPYRANWNPTTDGAEDTDKIKRLYRCSYPNYRYPVFAQALAKRSAGFMMMLTKPPIFQEHP
jgi:hypothetical protein